MVFADSSVVGTFDESRDKGTINGPNLTASRRFISNPRGVRNDQPFVNEEFRGALRRGRGLSRRGKPVVAL